MSAHRSIIQLSVTLKHTGQVGDSIEHLSLRDKSSKGAHGRCATSIAGLPPRGGPEGLDMPGRSDFTSSWAAQSKAARLQVQELCSL